MGENLVSCFAVLKNLCLYTRFPDYDVEMYDIWLQACCQIFKPCIPGRHFQPINSSSASQFSNAYIAAPHTCSIETLLPTQVRRNWSPFTSTCLNRNDSVAHFMTRWLKPKPEPCFCYRSSLKGCRKPEEWKKNLSFKCLVIFWMTLWLNSRKLLNLHEHSISLISSSKISKDPKSYLIL